MNDAADWDPNWWKKERDLSLERRQAVATSAGGVSAGDTFLIVTEGTVTEPIYFELLLATLDLALVAVLVIPGKASDPRHVIDTARDEAVEQERRSDRGELSVRKPAKYDHVWAVIDTDVAVRMEFWNDVQQLAAARNVLLAHSTPCFEFWLLLHIVGYTTRGDLPDGAAAKAAVEAALGRGYSTNKEVARGTIGGFIHDWPKAVIHAERVRRHHDDAATPSPGNPSTEMCRLVRALDESAPLYRRRLG